MKRKRRPLIVNGVMSGIGGSSSTVDVLRAAVVAVGVIMMLAALVLEGVAGLGSIGTDFTFEGND